MDFERSIVDKFWTDVPVITQEIRKAGVEQQVIVKTPVEEEAPQGPLFCGEGRVHIRKKAHRGRQCIYGWFSSPFFFLSPAQQRKSLEYLRKLLEKWGEMGYDGEKQESGCGNETRRKIRL